MYNRHRRAALAAACALAATLTLPVHAAGAGYSDVPEGAWYAQAVAYCQEQGLMSGTGEGQFSPDQPMTRGMLAAVLYRLEGSPAPSPEGAGEGAPFPDVPADSWYGPAVAWASRQGIMAGYPSGRFEPGEPATREQLAAVLWRYRGSPAASAEDFADEARISPYASAAVDWARSTGLMQGQLGGLFDPASRLTRAQMAQVLVNYVSSRRLTQVSAMDIMCQPCGIAAMEDGSLLVTDQYNKVIWRVADGKSIPFAGADTAEDPFGQPIGGYHDDTLPNSLFKNPWAIAPFLDGWAVSDPENGVIRFLRSNTDTAHGTAVTDLGIKFDHPTGLAVDEEGSLYVSETFLGTVQKITPAGRVTTLASNLSEPMGLCWADGALYAAECGGNRILRISKEGRVTVAAGSGSEGNVDGPASEAAFSGPKGVAVDADGTIYAADTDNGTVRRIRDGQVTTILSRDPSDATILYPAAPTGLLIQNGTLYISDAFARKLLAFPLR